MTISAITLHTYAYLFMGISTMHTYVIFMFLEGFIFKRMNFKTGEIFLNSKY
jgi:hypothetical protein